MKNDASKPQFCGIQTAGAEKNFAPKSKTPSARIVFEDREEILSEWLRRVKAEVGTADRLLNPILVNTIPLFLEGLAEALCEETARGTATESLNMPQEHGAERARVTRYGPDQLIQEFNILRDVIRKHILARAELSEREESVIQRSFDQAMRESLTAYFLVHNRIREQFVATLTHDLRNPINAIHMAADLIKDAVQGEVTGENFAQIGTLASRISKNVKRADRMIQDLLDASVIQVGERMNIQISEGNLTDIINESLSTLSEKQAKRIVAEIEPVIGFWDVGALQRSVDNLLSNAFKYGDDRLPVGLKVSSSHGRVMISVHNMGNPIPPEGMELLFQVFRRAEQAQHSGKQGWGIGLALVRSVAEHMGGSLGVESSIETGTTFTIDIPQDARPFVDCPTTDDLARKG